MRLEENPKSGRETQSHGPANKMTQWTVRGADPDPVLQKNQIRIRAAKNSDSDQQTPEFRFSSHYPI